MSDSNSSSSIGFFGILFFIFLVLKLTGYIDWSWVWVTSPLWLSFLVLFPIAITLMIIAAILSKK